MQIFVNDVAGRSLCVSGDLGTRVSSLKEKIAELQGIPTSEQHLVYGGRSLEASEELGACGIEDGSTVFLSLAMSGGGKKRKKKTYTKPKKIKHKRKKVKLAVLKFYKVDSND